MKSNKYGLSSGFQTDISKKLSKILYNKNTEFVCQLEDKYMKLALEEFLNDLDFKHTESNGDFALISLRKGIYKFYDKIPYDTRVYNIPSEWDILKMKIEKNLFKNPLKVKEKVGISKSDKENKKEEESRIYLINKDNYRHYKGYFSHNGYVFEIDTYDNEVNIKNKENTIDTRIGSTKESEDILISIMDKTIDIYDNNEMDGNKLFIYDSKRDGELKSKTEIEIIERKIVTTKNKGDGKDSKK